MGHCTVGRGREKIGSNNISSIVSPVVVRVDKPKFSSHLVATMYTHLYTYMYTCTCIWLHFYPTIKVPTQFTQLMSPRRLPLTECKSHMHMKYHYTKQRYCNTTLYTTTLPVILPRGGGSNIGMVKPSGGRMCMRSLDVLIKYEYSSSLKMLNIGGSPI